MGLPIIKKLRDAQYYTAHRVECIARSSEYKRKHRPHFNALERKWREENIERHRATKKRYYLKNREKILAKASAVHKANREKLNAQQQARRNIIKENYCCVVCGSSENLHFHHQDYSQPLDVVTLCHRHHMREHFMV